jgi:fucose 4-O-acetylase-like acetyltransferase
MTAYTHGSMASTASLSCKLWFLFCVWFTIDTAQSVDAMAGYNMLCVEYFISVASGAVLLAVQAVLDDPGFELLSPLAANAVQTAKQLQEWSQSAENKPYFDGFASQLVSELETALRPLSGGYKRLRVQREKMWG